MAVPAVPVQNNCRNERPQSSPRLIQRLIQAKHPSLTENLTRMRDHRFHCGPAYRTTGPLSNNERSRERPIAGQCQCGYREHVDGISENRDRPVAVGLVCKVSGKRTKPVADHLAKTSDKS